MLNKEQFKQAYIIGCQTMGVDPLVVVAGAGGVCTMLGLRQLTADVDVDVPTEVFKRIKEKGYPSHYFGNTLVLEVTEHMDVHEMMEEKRVTVIEGVTCYHPVEVLKFKLKLNREKDQADIKALQDYINKGN